MTNRNFIINMLEEDHINLRYLKLTLFIKNIELDHFYTDDIRTKLTGYYTWNYLVLKDG